jgi:hypothetical protein
MIKKRKQTTKQITVTFDSPEDAALFKKALKILKIPKVKTRSIALKYK